MNKVRFDVTASRSTNLYILDTLLGICQNLCLQKKSNSVLFVFIPSINNDYYCLSSEITRDFAVTYSDYNTKLVDLNSMRLHAVAKVRETRKMFSDQFEFRMDNRDAIEIKVI